MYADVVNDISVYTIFCNFYYEDVFLAVINFLSKQLTVFSRTFEKAVILQVLQCFGESVSAVRHFLPTAQCFT